MQISGLSARTGVSIASLKYYLREGLLMPGAPTSATRAEYDEGHVARVRLIRAFLEVGGMSIAQAKGVLQALDDPPETPTLLLSRAHTALPAPGLEAQETDEVRDLITRLGWQVAPDCPVRRSLTAAVAAARAAGVPLTSGDLERYAAGAFAIAEVDLAKAAEASTPADALHLAVVGTVMIDPVLSSLRRLAQETVSRARLG